MADPHQSDGLTSLQGPLATAAVYKLGRVTARQRRRHLSPLTLTHHSPGTHADTHHSHSHSASNPLIIFTNARDTVAPLDPWSSWVRVRAGAASLPGRLASRSRVAPTHTQRLPPPLKIMAASLSHRLARHRGRGEHRVMFATWPGSSTVDASHASEVKSIYASARCTCTRHTARWHVTALGSPFGARRAIDFM